MDIGNRKQIFIDHRFIDSAQDIELSVNPPVKLPGPVLTSDKPWEAFSIGWSCLIDDDGLYKLWYSASDHDQWAGGQWHLCYATSEDGRHWEKPELGLVEYDGSKRNNIIIPDCKLAYIFIDPNGGEAGRYKLVEQVRGSGIRVGSSPDGLVWNLPDELVSTLKPDTPKQVYWDERIGRYVAWLKLMVADDGKPMFPFVEPIASVPSVVTPQLLRPGRSIGRVEIDDLTAPWPKANIRTVLAADEQDPINSDFYHHDVLPYPEAEDAYFMFPKTYQHFDENESTVRNDGLNDVQFAASRDSIHWMRYDRRPYISRGMPGTFDSGTLAALPTHLRRGNRFLQMYGGSPWTHGGFRRLSDAEREGRSYGNGIGLVEQRVDGFVSADATYTGGTLTTPPIHFTGERLELNIDVAAMGQVQVEIQDAAGQPLPGFELTRCRRVLSNDLSYPVNWEGTPSFGAPAERPIRLHFVMRSAKLYSFQFC